MSALWEELSRINKVGFRRERFFGLVGRVGTQLFFFPFSRWREGTSQAAEEKDKGGKSLAVVFILSYIKDLFGAEMSGMFPNVP